ncbi:Protein decapping 5 [Striga hermonthica]|uniref:Protein decapping 5 n=1 Tax=Striga hermonthica TaxID=68872 RepID=A0A9N7RID9_STRHE|nr:Protein decapping 5 [Striga hermonthica]
MAAESSTAAASGKSGGGGASADTYIGSVISLTSKSEIRYEGILYNINTEESSIGLRNVRSFGTEGRKKDGPQVLPSDKIYEYILFRGSDIKDLQVKASPPVQTTPPPINNDPAIIQSHYPRPPAQTTSMPAAAPNASLPDPVSHSLQTGLPGSTFPNSLHLYQPGGNLNSWGPSPSNPNGSGLAMPMYWPGFYGTPNGLSQLPQQQSLLRPPPGLSIPPSVQQMQFSGFNFSPPMASSSLPTSTLQDYQSSLLPNSTSSSRLTPDTSLTSPSLSSNVPPLQPMPLVSEKLINPPQNKASPVSDSFTLTSTPSSSLPFSAQLPNLVPDKAGLHSVASKPIPIPGPADVAQQDISQPVPPSFSRTSASVVAEKKTPSLVTPGQLLQSVPAAVSSHTMQKDVEVVQVSSKLPPEALVPAALEAQPPILPLPANARAQKLNGGGYHMRNNYRGRGGRGFGMSRPVARFTEDFDFTAMNEKFNKDEVWGHLGKHNSKSKDKEDDESDEEDDLPVEDDAELPKIEVKPVYNKDDFFDSLSCNSLEKDPNHGRSRYSEQMKLDTETFGEFSTYRGRGGRGPSRGGGRFRGSYQGRGYGGYGGYVARGRGGRARNSLITKDDDDLFVRKILKYFRENSKYSEDEGLYSTRLPKGALVPPSAPSYKSNSLPQD